MSEPTDLIQSKPWATIVQFYQGLVDSGIPAQPLLKLVTQLAASKYANGGLFGTTSQAELLLVQTREFKPFQKVLRVELHGESLLFTFFEERYARDKWTVTCDSDRGFATLEHFLLDVKKWFRR